MFGFRMSVVHNNVSLILRPLYEEEVANMAKGLENYSVLRYTNMHGVPSASMEMEWYKKTCQDNTSVSWVIQPEGVGYPVGITSLHKLDDPANGCISGIIIWDQKWWGKGVASAAHLARTYYAANVLNRYTINSSVRDQNTASQKALERVGYCQIGHDPCDHIDNGQYIGTFFYKWFNPERVSILFPTRIPQEYRGAINLAERVLVVARNEVRFP